MTRQPPANPPAQSSRLRWYGQVLALVLLGLLACGMVVGMIITAVDLAQQEPASQTEPDH